MARRSNAYEIALEHALRMRGVPLLSIAEAQQPFNLGRTYKNFDYLIYRPEAAHLLCEVKGRKARQNGMGDPWIHAADLTCLEAWRRVFGDAYEPVLAFVFDVSGCAGVEAHHSAFGRDWTFWRVAHRDYQRLARPRSPKWRTLALSVKAFKSIATPFLDAFPASEVASSADYLATI